jgi:hypothetical protein
MNSLFKSRNGPEWTQVTRLSIPISDSQATPHHMKMFAQEKNMDQQQQSMVDQHLMELFQTSSEWYQEGNGKTSQGGGGGDLDLWLSADMNEPQGSNLLFNNPVSSSSNTAESIQKESKKRASNASHPPELDLETSMTSTEYLDKRKRNTIASQKFRAKKKLRDIQIQSENDELKAKVKDLEAKVREQDMEIKFLRTLVLEKSGDPKETILLSVAAAASSSSLRA